MNLEFFDKLKQAKNEYQKSWFITKSLLDAISPDLAEAAIAAAIPHWFDANILAAILQTEAEKAEPLYKELQPLPFTEIFGSLGHALHDLTRAGILCYLANQKFDQLQQYSQRAYDYFKQFDNSQQAVESAYHLLVIDKDEGQREFKYRMRDYLEESNFSAANNLIRNVQELIDLNVLKDQDVAAEIDRQKYLIGWKFVRLGKEEKSADKTREHLAQAIKIFEPTADIQSYQQFEAIKLRDEVSTLERQFLNQKLTDAKKSGDTIRQRLWLAEIGGLLVEEKNYEEALKQFNTAIAIEEKDKNSIARRGETYRQMGNYEAALADFNRAIELDEKYTWSIAHRGVTYRLMANYEAALADFNRAIELNEKYAWAIAHRGVTYRLMANYEAALADFNRAIELDEKYGWAIASRGETYRQMGNYEAALADFNRAIELDEKYGWAIASRGETYRQMGNYEAALADFNQAIELDEKYGWAIASRGQTYRQMGNYEAALPDFNRAIEMDEKYAWAIAQRGETYRLMSNYEAALIDFNRAIELNEELNWAFVSRGQTYRQMGNYEAALVDYDRAIEQDAKYARAFAGRGEINRLMSRYEAAGADFERAIELDEKYTWAIARRGQTYKQVGNFQAALLDFNRAIELDEKYAWAIAQRAKIYRLVGNNEAALADLSRVIELDPKNDWYFYSRGFVNLYIKNISQALSDLSQAITLAIQIYESKPEDWRNNFNLALYYLASENIEQAENIYKIASDTAVPIPNLQEAIDDLSDFLKYFPDRKHAQTMRSLLQQYLEKAKDAI